MAKQKLPAGTIVDIYFTTRGEAAGVVVTGPDGVWWRAGNFTLKEHHTYVPKGRRAAKGR